MIVWISVIAAMWAFMSPVRADGERSTDARHRFLGLSFTDPFLWVALVLVVYSAVVALNSGVRLCYDAEQKLWRLLPATVPFLPGGAEGSGDVLFAVSLLVLAVYPAVVHSLDSRQTVYFAIIASLAVVADAVFAYASGAGIDGNNAVAYGFWALVAAAAMFSAERSRRRSKEMISAFALAGCFAALLFSARPVVACVFGAAVLVLALVFVGFMFGELGPMGVIRALLMVFVAAAVAAVLFHWRSGDWQSLIPVWHSEADPVLNRFAVETWEANPWTGSGVGSFPLLIKLGATAEDWMTLGAAPDFGGNGWRLLLVERGLVGVLAFAVSVGAMAFTWFRYARQRGLEKFAAAVPLLPVAVIAVALVMCFDSSALQGGAIVAFVALAAFSVNGGQ